MTIDQGVERRVSKLEDMVAAVQADVAAIRAAVASEHTTVLAEVKRINGSIRVLEQRADKAAEALAGLDGRIDGHDLFRAQIRAVVALLAFMLSIFGATSLALVVDILRR